MATFTIGSTSKKASLYNKGRAIGRVDINRIKSGEMSNSDTSNCLLTSKLRSSTLLPTDDNLGK